MPTPPDADSPCIATAPPPLEAHLGFGLPFVSNHVSQLRFRQPLEAEGVTVTERVALHTLWAQPGSHAG